MGRIGGFKDSRHAGQYRKIYARVRAQWPPGAVDRHIDTRFGGTHMIRHGQGPPVVLVLWLEDVLDGLGIDTAHVGGLSYGAWASMQLAWHAPSSCTGACRARWRRHTRRW